MIIPNRTQARLSPSSQASRSSNIRARSSSRGGAGRTMRRGGGPRSGSGTTSTSGAGLISTPPGPSRILWAADSCVAAGTAMSSAVTKTWMARMVFPLSDSHGGSVFRRCVGIMGSRSHACRNHGVADFLTPGLWLLPHQPFAPDDEKRRQYDRSCKKPEESKDLYASKDPDQCEQKRQTSRVADQRGPQEGVAQYHYRRAKTENARRGEAAAALCHQQKTGRAKYQPGAQRQHCERRRENREQQWIAYAGCQIGHSDKRAFNDGYNHRTEYRSADGFDHLARKPLAWLSQQAIGGFQKAICGPGAMAEKSKKSNERHNKQKGAMQNLRSQGSSCGRIVF